MQSFEKQLCSIQYQCVTFVVVSAGYDFQCVTWFCGRSGFFWFWLKLGGNANRILEGAEKKNCNKAFSYSILFNCMIFLRSFLVGLLLGEGSLMRWAFFKALMFVRA